TGFCEPHCRRLALPDGYHRGPGCRHRLLQSLDPDRVPVELGRSQRQAGRLLPSIPRRSRREEFAGASTERIPAIRVNPHPVTCGGVSPPPLRDGIVPTIKVRGAEMTRSLKISRAPTGSTAG